MNGPEPAIALGDDRGQQAGDAQGVLDTRLQRAGIAQQHRHEGADQRQTSPLELIAEHGRDRSA